MHPIPQAVLGLVFDIEGAITDVDRGIGVRMMLETATLAPENRLAIAVLRAVCPQFEHSCEVYAAGTATTDIL
ncbi:hypothetical protein GCM10020255_028740 [Rhodococcus baikonurensis]